MSESTAGRGGLWVAVLMVVGVLGLAAWFTLGGGAASADTTTGDVAISKPEDDAAVGGAGFHAAEAPEVTPLTAATPKPAHPTELVPAPVAAPAPGLHVVARGHVLWPGGKLPAESDVKLFDDEGYDLDLAYTEEDGSFELSSDQPLLAGWSFGTDAIEVPHLGGRAWLAPALVGNLPAHGLAEAPIERDLVVGFAPVISGRVVDRETQLPIEGAEVQVASTLPSYSFDILTADTDIDGRYTLELEDTPLSSLLVWCRADDHQALLAGPLDLQPAASPQDTTRQDFALAAFTAVHGRVIDALTREPIDGVVITVGSRYSAFSGDSDFAITEEDGTFELEAGEIPQSGGWLVFSLADYAAAVLPLEAGTSFVEVALDPAVTVSGLVTDQTGKPVPHARLEFAFDGDTPSLEQQMFDQADTEMDGRFEVELELAPVLNTIVRVEQVGKQPFRARLQDIGRALPENRWDIVVRLLDR